MAHAALSPRRPVVVLGGLRRDRSRGGPSYPRPPEAGDRPDARGEGAHSARPLPRAGDRGLRRRERAPRADPHHGLLPLLPRDERLWKEPDRGESRRDPGVALPEQPDPTGPR